LVVGSWWLVRSERRTNSQEIVLERAAQQIYAIENVESDLARAGAANSELAHGLRDIRNDYVTTLQSLVKELSKSNWEA
jgi:hypothetical protein